MVDEPILRRRVPPSPSHSHTPGHIRRSPSTYRIEHMALNWVMLESDGRPVPLPGEAFLNVFFNTAVTVVVGASTPLRGLGVMYASQQRVCLPWLIRMSPTPLRLISEISISSLSSLTTQTRPPPTECPKYHLCSSHYPFHICTYCNPNSNSPGSALITSRFSCSLL